MSNEPKQPDYQGAFNFMVGYIIQSGKSRSIVDPIALFQATYDYYGVLPSDSAIEELNLKIK